MPEKEKEQSGLKIELHGGEAGSELIRGVRIKNIREKKIGKVGEIAHYHKMEDETKEWEQACLFVEHLVRDPAGFRINTTNYAGKVVVPACVAADLTYMESAREVSEAGIFRNRGKEKFLRELHG